MSGSEHAPRITTEGWGTTSGGEPVDRHTLAHGALRVAILNYGAILQSVETPDRDGRSANVTLGFAELGDYERSSPYFGCVAGRFANRIRAGRFTLDGEQYRVPVNNGPNSLHGGEVGFDKRVWAATPLPGADAVALRLRHTSPDGDQGYPGTLRVTVTYTLTGTRAGGDLRIDYEASTDATTVVNLTNHAYFNLAGEGAGSVDGHLLRLAASRYTPVDDTLIPTGELAPVAGTPMDFTTATAIGARNRDGSAQLRYAQGYDHNWVLDRRDDSYTALEPAARVGEPDSGRTLEVHTTEPGIQFYGGNFLDGTLVGTGGRAYRQGDAFCLETQHFPDSPNQPRFPSTVLRPGAAYRSSTVYRFGVAG
jgi:aldose 1-epimerase